MNAFRILNDYLKFLNELMCISDLINDDEIVQEEIANNLYYVKRLAKIVEIFGIDFCLPDSDEEMYNVCDNDQQKIEALKGCRILVISYKNINSFISEICEDDEIHARLYSDAPTSIDGVNEYEPQWVKKLRYFRNEK